MNLKRIKMYHSSINRKNKLRRFFKLAKEKTKTINTYNEIINLLESVKFPNVFLDSPMGSKKGFGDKKRELPFDYGEFSDWINPADNMGWDIIIPPSNRDVFDLKVLGIVKIKNDKKLWNKKADKEPPVGNDKLIVASSGRISGRDISIIENFFNDMWQFEKVSWFWL